MSRPSPLFASSTARTLVGIAALAVGALSVAAELERARPADVGARGWPGSLGEFGWGGAYHTTYWIDPREELVVVHLTQTIPAGNVDDFQRVRALIYQAIDD